MVLLLLLIVIAVLRTASGANTTGSVYYIVANNDTSCPLMKNATCESLEYYMNDTKQYFTSNTTFYFMEGVHIIGHYQSLLIHQVSNLTLIGHQEVHHDTQPKAVIKCASPTSNILITFSNNITVINLTITNCGRRWHLSSLLSLQYYLYLYSRGSRISIFALFNVTLGLIETVNVTLQNVSLLDNFGFGLCTINTFELVINQSLFLRNNYDSVSKGCTELCHGGNIAILFTDEYIPCSQDAIIYNVSITNTKITYGREGLSNIGAGLYIFMEQVSVYGVRMLINEIYAYNNSGNIALVTTTQVTHYEIIIDNLMSGYTETFGGGFFMLTYDVGIKYVHCGYGWLYIRNPLRITNSEFFSNTNLSIMFHFGILDQSQAIDEVQLENITISDSYNEEILVSGRNTQTKFLLKKLTIRDHAFLPLGSSLAVVVVFSANNLTFEDIILENSRGTAIFAINSNIYVKGVKNLFKNNTGLFGGAIALYSSSILFIMEDTLISFINNYAQTYGGAIYIDKAISINCFFQVQANSKNPLINNTNIYFENNNASAGSSIYGGNIDNCVLLTETNVRSIVSNSSELFDTVAIFNDTRNTNSVISSKPARACFCYNNITDCHIDRVNVIAYPGQNITIPVVTVGQRYGHSPGTLKALVLQNAYIISKTLLTSQGQCTNLSYTLAINRNIGHVNTTFLDMDLLFDDLVNVPHQLIKSIVVEIDVLGCPPGFELSEMTGTCVCDQVIINALTDVTCNIQSLQITSNRGNMWMGYDSTRSCAIAFANCSYDYCITSGFTLNISIPDTQCAFNRAGILCGGCADGYSLVLGSNKCKLCSNVSLLLIVVFALAGIGLVALLILLNLTVSIGAINGVIFFANIVKINESLFFPHGPIPLLSQFISWLNLDFGVEACFYDGMNSTAKIWLQFVFPFYIWIIIAVVVFLSRYTKFYKLIGSQAVPVLATLTLLSYMKLFRIITIVLQSINITCGDDVYTKLKWYFDSNIDYLSKEHLYLVMFTLFVLLFLAIPYTVVLLFSQLLEGRINQVKGCHFWIRFKPIFDAYGGPYKDKYRFWTGLLLVVRLVLLFVVSFSNNKDNVITAVITSVAVLLALSLSFWGVYKNRLINFSELFFFILLISMSALATTVFVFIGTIITLTMALIAFVVIVLGHFYLKFKNTVLMKKVKSCFKVFNDHNQEVNIAFAENDQVCTFDKEVTSFELSRRDSIIYEDEVGGFYLSMRDKNSQ